MGSHNHTNVFGMQIVVQTNATKALVTTKICVGADISIFLQDLNPQLLGTIESEFNSQAGKSPPVPTRQSADITHTTAAEASGAKGKGKATAGGDPLDELFPRVDHDRLLASSTIKTCDDPAWKICKEFPETIQGILEQNKRLKPNLGSDLLASLKLRLANANKAVQSLALDVISRIATGMGKPFECYAKTLALAILTILAGKNSGARNHALATLTSIADACELDCLILSVGAALEIAKSELRASALNWIVHCFTDPEAVKGLDLTSFASPINGCTVCFD